MAFSYIYVVVCFYLCTYLLFMCYLLFYYYLLLQCFTHIFTNRHFALIPPPVNKVWEEEIAKHKGNHCIYKNVFFRLFRRFCTKHKTAGYPRGLFLSPFAQLPKWQGYARGRRKVKKTRFGVFPPYTSLFFVFDAHSDSDLGVPNSILNTICFFCSPFCLQIPRTHSCRRSCKQSTQNPGLPRRTKSF